METLPEGTPVVVTFRGKMIPGRIAGHIKTLKGPFYKIEEADGHIRSARPAHVTETAPPPAA